MFASTMFHRGLYVAAILDLGLFLFLMPTGEHAPIFHKPSCAAPTDAGLGAAEPPAGPPPEEALHRGEDGQEAPRSRLAACRDHGA